MSVINLNDEKRFCSKSAWNECDYGCICPPNEEVYQCSMYMHYHPDEMGFGGPYVYFGWNEDGWIMTFVGKGKGYSEREVNMDIHRFLAMRRAGYPVLYRTRDY